MYVQFFFFILQFALWTKYLVVKIPQSVIIEIIYCLYTERKKKITNI